MRFSYVALTPEGETTQGSIKAKSAGSARVVVEDRDLDVVEIHEAPRVSIEVRRSRVKRDELMHFSRQLAAFVRAGVPITDAIGVIAEETRSPAFRRALVRITEALHGGALVSEAVAEHPSVFPPFYVAMLRAAELTGRLDVSLDQLSHYIERDLEGRRRVRSALAYPLIVLVMSLITVGVITTFVLPRFKSFFESFDAKLPLPTRVLLGVTGFLGDWWWALALGAGAVAVGVVAAVRTRRGRRAYDRMRLRLPAVGTVIRFSIIERFCRTLASMVQAGVPLPQALDVAMEGTNNVAFTEGLGPVRDGIYEGEGIARPIARSELFPGPVVQLFRVGEATGTLDQQLASAADFYEQELDYRIKKLTTLFEPAVIVGVGLLVGFVAIAMVSAMYGIFRSSAVQ